MTQECHNDQETAGATEHATRAKITKMTSLASWTYSATAAAIDVHVRFVIRVVDIHQRYVEVIAFTRSLPMMDRG